MDSYVTQIVRGYGDCLSFLHRTEKPICVHSEQTAEIDFANALLNSVSKP